MWSRQSPFLSRMGLTRTALVAAATIFFIVTSNHANNNSHTNVQQINGEIHVRGQGDDNLDELYASLNKNQRCLDPEDPPEWYTPDIAELHPCTCPDPFTAVKRTNKSQRKRWMIHHDNMVEKMQSIPRTDLDVVFFGDSITERWMGLKAMGNVQKPEFRHVFEAYFKKSKGGLLKGEAFGTGGDTAPELFWHLKNGLLPQRLQPRSILLLIGTNDLGLPMCSKKNTLAAILHIATFLREKRPDATMIIHGLTPRNEYYGDKNFDLGVRWEQIKWINQRLRDYAAQQDDWYYIENSDLFIRHDDPTMINATLMKDALHPTVEGYKLWAPRLSQQIQDILQLKG